MNKKIIIFLGVVLVLVIAYFSFYEPDTLSPKGRVSQVVDNYMKYTLGSLSDSKIDYDKARLLLTESLKSEFQTPAFIPHSYCIQDGPEKVQVDSINFSVNDQNQALSRVFVKAKYGEDWVEVWEFHLIELEDGWLINSIECLQ